MSVMNIVQIVFLFAAVTVGGVIKLITGGRVKELDGIRGLVKTREECYHGKIEGKFGD